LPPADNGYHRKCYQNYTHAKALKKLSLEACIPQPTTEQEAKVRVSSRKKSRGVEEIIHFCLRYIEKILADQECCICEKRKTAKCGSGYEALEKCETENGARTLQQAAALHEYSLLQAKVLAIIQPSRFVTFVWDNNDINPESLKGLSLHCTNSIVIQSSIVALNQPEPFSTIVSAIQCGSSPKAKQERGTLNRIFRTGRASIILLCEGDSDDYDKIGYLPSISKSPTSHDTVLELLSQSKLKAEKLGLNETDVILDMAIYSKAVEIMMNPRYIDLKKFIVLHLGGFHTMCIFIAVIGKRFGDAGLRDIVIESNLLGESSVEQMLKGKHYNNAMRIPKYLYNAIKRHLIDSYEQSESDQPDLLSAVSYEELIDSEELQKFVSSPTQQSLDSLSKDHKEMIDEIHKYEASLLNGALGPTASVWSSFLQMVQILLDFARSVKLGDWKLHLQSTEYMLPWMFGYDRLNYTRFLTYYLVTMKKLPETHPALHQQFESGHFSVRRQHGRFNKIPSDQAIEQTINREQKCAGGIIGYSTDKGTVQRWSLTSHIAAKCQSKLEEFLGMSEANSVTKDLARKRIRHDEECVARSYDLIKEWGTPFKENTSLIHLKFWIGIHRCNPR
ncbi:Hypothetical predicted protein, partial [Paramuricea clavata]